MVLVFCEDVNLSKQFIYLFCFTVNKNVRYYLNIDVCAYGGTRSTQDITTGQKVVYGPDVFAVDQGCKKAFYFVEWEFKWRQIYSSKFVNFTYTVQRPLNLTCAP